MSTPSAEAAWRNPAVSSIRQSRCGELILCYQRSADTFARDTGHSRDRDRPARFDPLRTFGAADSNAGPCPRSGHSGLAPPLPEAPARSWGRPTRYDGVKADGTELAEGVSPRVRYRFPTGSPNFAAR